LSLKRRKSKPASDDGAEPSPRVTIESLRLSAGIVGLFVFVGAAVFGLERLKDRVYDRPEYNPPIQVQLADPPAWVEREGWHKRILSVVKIPEDQQWLDEMLVRRVADQINCSGWVSRVHTVAQRMDGVIRISCDYRRPIAMIQTANGYIPVDRFAVRLPEVYERVEDGTGWMRIVGVETTTPDVGEAFAGDDAVAAVRLASVLFEQDFAQRITAIDVLNFRGRRDKHDNHIKLRTVDGRRIDWGSAIGEEIEEPTVQEKVRTIALYFKKGSPQARIDVSVYRNGWIEPVEPAIHTADGSRSRGR